MNAEQIVEQRNNISLITESSNQFCQAWPSVKQGLLLLEGIIKNPIAKGAISLVISAGDAVSAKICGIS